jgi:ribosomal protein S18 acetylase RimI-like enzyme
MSMTEIRVGTPADEAAGVAVVVLAFADDPVARWCWPGPAQYLAHFPAFVRAFGGKAFTHGSAFLAEGYAGAALWLPPGVEPDGETMMALLEDTTPPARRGDIAALLEQMERYHLREPHWYLPLIGVDPAGQGRGVGAALMRHALAACDREGSAAYLEANNPKNVPFYERHGFELLGTIESGSSPPLFAMLRMARR